MLRLVDYELATSEKTRHTHRYTHTQKKIVKRRKRREDESK